jgi:hypothetical protein
VKNQLVMVKDARQKMTLLNWLRAINRLQKSYK